MLRAVVVTLGAIALALAIPRVGGEEYFLSIRWDRSVLADEMLPGSADYPRQTGILSVGSGYVALFAIDTGTTVYTRPRHERFAASPTHYINQASGQATGAGDRLVVTDRRTGARSFHQARGIPRLYDDLLVQFAPGEIFLESLQFRTSRRLTHDERLTTFDLVAFDPAAVGGNTDGRVQVVTGDIFGTHRVTKMDFAGDTLGTVEWRDPAGTIPVVYGVHLVSRDPTRVLSVHGQGPQVLELWTTGADDREFRYEIPRELEVDSPPTIRFLEDGLYAVGLAGAVLFVDTEGPAAWTVAHSGPPAVAGRVFNETTGFGLAFADTARAMVLLRESASADVSNLVWDFPEMRVAGLEPSILVLERNDHFFALELLR